MIKIQEHGTSAFFFLDTFIIVTLGYIISVVGAALLTDIVAGVVIFPTGWDSAFSLIDYFTSQRVTWLVYTGGWFGVCIVVNMRTRKWLEKNGQIRILSPFFIVLWIIVTLAVITGFLIKTWLVGTFSWDGLIDMLFVALFWALAPTFATQFGCNTE